MKMSMDYSGSDVKGGIGSFFITPLAVYTDTRYIMPSRGLYNPYHPLPEPEQVYEVVCPIEHDDFTLLS